MNGIYKYNVFFLFFIFLFCSHSLFVVQAVQYEKNPFSAVQYHTNQSSFDENSCQSENAVEGEENAADVEGDRQETKRKKRSFFQKIKKIVSKPGMRFYVDSALILGYFAKKYYNYYFDNQDSTKLSLRDFKKRDKMDLYSDICVFVVRGVVRSVILSGAFSQ